MPKTTCFLTSLFSGFGIDLGGFGRPSWVQDGPKCEAKTRMHAHDSLLKLNLFSKCRLGGLQARFWRVWGGFWEGLGRALGQKIPWPHPKTPRNAKNLPRTCRDLARTRRLSKKVFLDGEQGGARVSKNAGAAVLPPPGGFQ